MKRNEMKKQQQQQIPHTHLIIYILLYYTTFFEDLSSICEMRKKNNPSPQTAKITKTPILWKN